MVVYLIVEEGWDEIIGNIASIHHQWSIILSLPEVAMSA